MRPTEQVTKVRVDPWYLRFLEGADVRALADPWSRLLPRRHRIDASEWDGILCTRNVLDLDRDQAWAVPAALLAYTLDT